jgi:hypothetical protein
MANLFNAWLESRLNNGVFDMQAGHKKTSHKERFF